MESVKIKRVKRNKKQVTTKEKIVAGFGVGGTLLGGASMAKPPASPQQTQFVRTESKGQGSSASKIKAALGKIFGPLGIKTAEAAAPTVNVNGLSYVSTSINGFAYYGTSDGYQDVNGNPIYIDNRGVATSAPSGDGSQNDPVDLSGVSEGQTFRDPVTGTLYKFNGDGTVTNVDPRSPAKGQTGYLDSAGYLQGTPVDNPGKNPFVGPPVTVDVTPTTQNTAAPTITLNGSASDTAEYGVAYTDPGATAVDSLGNTVTVTAGGSIDMYKLNTPQTITYSATDDFGTATAQRTVTVVETTAVKNFIDNAGSLTKADFDKLSADDQASVTAYFNSGAYTAPQSFSAGSFLAYGLGLYGKTQATVTGQTYYLSGDIWSTTQATATTVSAGSLRVVAGQNGITTFTVTGSDPGDWVASESTATLQLQVTGHSVNIAVPASTAPNSYTVTLSSPSTGVNTTFTVTVLVTGGGQGGQGTTEYTDGQQLLGDSLGQGYVSGVVYTYSAAAKAWAPAAGSTADGTTLNAAFGGGYQNGTAYTYSGGTAWTVNGSTVYVGGTWTAQTRQVDAGGYPIVQGGETYQGEKTTSYTETYYGGQWVLDNNQFKTDNGLKYHTSGGVWVLDDGQTAKDHPNQVTSGGVWIYTRSGGGSATVNGKTYTYSNGVYIAADGSTLTPEQVQLALTSNLTAGNINTTTYDPMLDGQINSLNLSGYTIPNSVTAGSVLAFMLGLGDGSDGTTSRKGSDGRTYNLQGKNWITTDQSTGNQGNTAPKQGDKKTEAGLNYTYKFFAGVQGGQWVLDAGQQYYASAGTGKIYPANTPKSSLPADAQLYTSDGQGGGIFQGSTVGTASTAKVPISLVGDGNYWGTQDQDFLVWLQNHPGAASGNVTVGYDANKNITSYNINGVTYTPQQLAAAIESIGKTMAQAGVGVTGALDKLSASDQAIYFLGTAALALPGAPVTNLPLNTFDARANGVLLFSAPTTTQVVSPFDNATTMPATGTNPLGLSTSTEANTALAAIQKFHPDAKLYEANNYSYGTFTTSYNNENRRYWEIVYTDQKTGQQIQVDVATVLEQLDSSGKLAKDPSGSALDVPISSAFLMSAANPTTNTPATIQSLTDAGLIGGGTQNVDGSYTTVSGTGVAKTTTGVATTITGPTVSNVTTKVVFTNLTSGNTSTLSVGDKWTMVITGPTNTDVYITGGLNGATDTTKMGTTDHLTGQLTLSGTITAGQVGSWNEIVKIGNDTKNLTTVGTLKFVVVAASTGGGGAGGGGSTGGQASGSVDAATKASAIAIYQSSNWAPGTPIGPYVVAANGNLVDQNGNIIATRAAASGNNQGQSGGQSGQTGSQAARLSFTSSSSGWNQATNTLTINAGDVQQVTASGQSVLSVVTQATNILINNTNGVITIIGLSPSPNAVPSTITVQAADGTIYTIQVIVLPGTTANTAATGNLLTIDQLNQGNTGNLLTVGQIAASGSGSTTGSSTSNEQLIAQLRQQITDLQNRINNLQNNANAGISPAAQAQITALQNQVNSLSALVSQLQRGGITTLGSAVSQPFSGLQMQSVVGNDLSARYANVNGTIYDKNTGQAFSTPQEFFNAAGVSSFSGLIFDTQWQPGGQVQGASIGATYTVKKGDTLSSIAKRLTGNASNWRKILAANPRCLSIPGNTKTLRIGFTLNIPSL